MALSCRFASTCRSFVIQGRWSIINVVEMGVGPDSCICRLSAIAKRFAMNRFLGCEASIITGMGSSEVKYAKYAYMVEPERIERWLAWTGVNPRTRSTYLDGMMALFAYVEDEGLEFASLGADDIAAFRSHLSSSSKRPTTVSTYLEGVRSFYRFTAAGNKPEADIAKGVKGIRSERGFKKEVLRRNEALELLASIERDTLKGKRDFAIINLMIRTGLRDIEVVRALVGDLVPAEDEETYILRVQGKGRQDKKEFVVLDEATLSPIRNYLIERGVLDKDEEPLFVSHANRNRGQALTTRSLSRIVKERLCAIGLAGDTYTAHSLRHTSVTFSLLGGATIQEAQAMARHADINTTLIYSHNLQRFANPAEAKVGAYLDGLR